MSKWKQFFVQPRLACAIALTLVAFITATFLDQTNPSNLHKEWVDMLVERQQEILESSDAATDEQLIQLVFLSESIADSIERRNKWGTMKRIAPYVLFFCALGLFVIHLMEYRVTDPEESEEDGDAS